MPLTMSKTSRLPAHSEQELVAAIRAGDDRAFEELYGQYRDRIFAFILSKVHDHGRAEDIAQEVFMSALRRLRGADQAIAFKPWIYEIAKNACIDEFRRGSRAREVPLEGDGGSSWSTARSPRCRRSRPRRPLSSQNNGSMTFAAPSAASRRPITSCWSCASSRACPTTRSASGST